MLHEASLYTRKEEGRTSCCLCSHRCNIAPGKFGICNVRENVEGTLYTHSYGLLIARHIDPVEKKPLYHFQPGSLSYSIAAAGCNFQCEFCQNWEISQIKEVKKLGLQSMKAEPRQIVEAALRSGCRSISYTYTEPTIFFEFARDTGVLAKEAALRNVFVTNGFMTGEALNEARSFLDAANVDLKSFRDDYYRKVCKGRLDPVLKSIAKMREHQVWVEVTTLIVPGLNDSDEELKDIAGFLAGLDVNIPWHISRFHPQYKMGGAESTPMETLNRAYRIGKEAGLRFVYQGNVIGKGNHTYCYNCDRLLIERSGFNVGRNETREGKCPGCNSPIAGLA
ncbi:MAG: AmmeMemoRadiSam system radical SAM enzyme [Syntrophaceae bacterium]